MPEETLRFNVELDVPGLQSQLDMARSSVGSSLQSSFNTAGGMFQTGGMAFNSVQGDIGAARHAFMLSMPAFPSGIGIPQGPGNPFNFSQSVGQVGLASRVGMELGLLAPHPQALVDDVRQMQNLNITEKVVRGAAGVGLNFAMPLGVGAAATVLGTALIPIPGAGLVAGLAAETLADAVGGAAYEQIVTRRDRELILRSSGMDQDFSKGLSHAMSSLRTDASLIGAGMDTSEVTQMMTQNAFSKRINPRSGGKEDIQRAVGELREDLKAVADIRAALDMTFDEAAPLLSAMQSKGLSTAGSGAGSVRDTLARTRAMGSFGFSPGEQRAALVEGLQVASHAQAVGVDPATFMQTVGMRQVFASEMFREGLGGGGFLGKMAGRAGSAQEFGDRAAEGMSGFSKMPIAQSAMLAALMEDPTDLQGASDKAAQLMGQGPGAIAQHMQNATGGMSLLEAGTRLQSAQSKVGALQELMVADPRAGLKMVGGVLSNMNQTISGFGDMSAEQQGTLLGGMLQRGGIDAGGESIKTAIAMFREATKEAAESQKSLAQVLDERIDAQMRKMEEQEKKREDALGTVLTQAARDMGNTLLEAFQGTDAGKYITGKVKGLSEAPEAVGDMLKAGVQKATRGRRSMRAAERELVGERRDAIRGEVESEIAESGEKLTTAEVNSRVEDRLAADKNTSGYKMALVGKTVGKMRREAAEHDDADMLAVASALESEGETTVEVFGETLSLKKSKIAGAVLGAGVRAGEVVSSALALDKGERLEDMRRQGKIDFGANTNMILARTREGLEIESEKGNRNATQRLSNMNFAVGQLARVESGEMMFGEGGQLVPGKGKALSQEELLATLKKNMPQLLGAQKGVIGGAVEGLGGAEDISTFILLMKESSYNLNQLVKILRAKEG